MTELQDLLPGIKKNVLLAQYTSLHIGGPADYFFEAKNTDDLIKAIEAAQEFNTPYFILGGGTNLLVSDEGFRGLVIKVRSEKYEVRGEKIYTDAGVLIATLVSEAAKNNLSGLEWAAGIPGTVGGAIKGNAGSFGFSISDVVKSVRVMKIQGQEIQNSKFKIQNDNLKFKIISFKNRECKFGYRESIFKENPNFIILSAQLQLKKGNKSEIQKKIKENLKYRKENHPPYFSCGCVFKNVKLTNLHPKKIFSKFNGASKSKHKYHKYNNKKFAEISGRSVPISDGKIPTGYLIDELGLKGLKIGNAMISSEHGNFIINTGKATAEDVIILISVVKQKVRNKFGILLEEEIQYIGF